MESCSFLLSAGRQISSRIRHSKYLSSNHSRTYLLSRLWIRFHVFPPFAANSRTTCAVANLRSHSLMSSLYQRHCAAKSSNEFGSSSQTASLSVTFDIATLASSSTNADTTGYLSNVRGSDSLRNAVTVDRCTCSSTECRVCERPRNRHRMSSCSARTIGFHAAFQSCLPARIPRSVSEQLVRLRKSFDSTLLSTTNAEMRPASQELDSPIHLHDEC